MPQSVAITDPGLRLVSTPGIDLDLAAVVRQLVDQNGISHPAEVVSAEEVVIGVEVDGVSYALVRLPPDSPAGVASLSPREREIVRLVAKGFPNKTIAAILDVSAWTVATHLRRGFAKLGVNTRTEMVAQALTQGLIEPERPR
jgi:DNA-binding CsgD family transcriptional regulator